MKYLLLILIMFPFLGLDTKEQIYFHVGYKDGKPLLHKVGTNKVVSIDENNHLAELDIDIGDHIPEFINDCALVVMEHKVKDRFVVRSAGGVTKNYKSRDKIGSITLNNDCKYLAFSSNDSVFVFRNGKLINKIKGERP